MGGCVSGIRQKVAAEEERKACCNAYKGLLSIAIRAGCVLPQQMLRMLAALDYQVPHCSLCSTAAGGRR